MALSLGILAQNETFAPARPVTKAEALKLVLAVASTRADHFRYNGPDEPNLSDEWYSKYLAQALELDLMTPDVEALSPDATIDRSQAAALLSKILNNWLVGMVE